MANVLQEHLYQYRFASRVDQTLIHLAASGGAADTRIAGPFFTARVKQPRDVATMLLTLSSIVRTHFFDARPPQMDPIVTASRSLVRWEGFSGCCGAYARLDLDECAFETEARRFGTTNVDFNPDMLAHLGRIGRADDVRLSIDSDAVTLEHNQSAVTEKKVRLPRRWIKGLGEVQVYQSRLELKQRFTPATLVPLIQNAARMGGGNQYLSIAAGRPRLTTREAAGTIPVGGASRLSALRTILPLVREVSLYADEGSGVHAWVGETDWCRFWLVLSPALQRGFSGEGQVLDSLVRDDWQERVDSILDLLAGSETTPSGPAETIDPAELAVQLGCTTSAARVGLSALATNGLAGFDAGNGFYFQRQLPFEETLVTRDQPRLRAAQKLFEQQAVRLLPDESPGKTDAEVNSNGTTYFVRFRPEGEKCTCPWFSRYQGKRGVCKHILATRMTLEAKHHD
ncbi:MAG: SWIM zinc finger family protein [Planctomycetota bacterium]